MAGAPEGNQNAKKWNLNDKQKRFYHEYLIDFNQTQAAIRAGYSKKTAYSQGNRLLKHVEGQEFLNYIRNKAFKKYEITEEKIVQEFAKIGFSNITDAYKNWMTLEEFEILKKEKPDICACISEISTKTEYKKEADRVTGKIEYIRLKFYSKTEALKNLGQYKGIYKEDNKQKSEFLQKIFSGTKIILENGTSNKK